jgi:hypothetical protein
MVVPVCLLSTEDGHASASVVCPQHTGNLMLTLRQTHMIASHMSTSSVDRVLLLPIQRVLRGELKLADLERDIRDQACVFVSYRP